ncbi:MAG TPA: YCF48-related protein [Terriglobales bacterium]|jgi:photosynthesis system II assembly factor YCF48-like protein/putative zinc finger protein|nr:YCF48-related protein [Terriglobales bacterium]
MPDLPKIAMQRLHQKSATAEIHPDPNLISAFAENSLADDSRDQVMRHLAQCGDCREVVFLSAPEQAATLPAAASAPSRWLTWPVLRWGAAVAAVVVVVAAVSLHHQSGGVSTSPGAIQMTDAPIAKEKAASVSIPEEKRKMAPETNIAPVPPVVTSVTTADAEDKRPDELKKQSSRVAASPMLAQKSEIANAKGANDHRDELDKTTTVEATAQSVAVGVEAGQVVPGRAKDAAAAPASDMSAALGSATAMPPHPQMFMPVVAPRWTVTSEGMLQRSLDLGRSWQTVQVASQTSFRALAASGKDIWVGGSKGALYHSTDAGQHWAQVQPVAAGQTLSDDIVGVEFPDSLHGKLTTASKEIWTTEDGGQIWLKQ